MYDVLLDLAIPVVQKDDIFSKIDFVMMHKLGAEMGASNVTYFGSLVAVNELNKANANLTEGPLNYGSTTKFFFYCLEAMNKFFVPILKHAENMSMQLERIEKEIQKSPANDYKRKMMENYLEKARNEFFMYRIALEDDERATLINTFYSRFFKHLLTNFKGKILVPNYYLLDYIEFQSFFANIKKGYFARFGTANFDLYLSMLEELLNDAYKQPNPFVQAKFFDLLFTFNIMEKGRVVYILRDHLGSHERIRRFLLAMIDFYSAIEFMNDAAGTSQTKYRYRFFITNFLLKALTIEDYIRAFKDICTEKEVSNFIGHLFTDLNFFLEDAFEKLKKIGKLQQGNIDSLANDFQRMQVGNQQGNSQNQNSEEENASVEQETVPALTSSVKSLFKFGRNHLKMIDILSQIVPDVFSDPEWATKIAQTLNYYASKMCSKSYRAYKFQNIADVRLKPLEFIRQLVLVYARISDSAIVRQSIINDDRSYSKDALFDLGVTAYNKKLVPADLLEKYQNLISTLDVMKIEKDNMETIIGEAPEEFTCGLTFDLMKDPVYLPASKLTVERNAIRQHLTLNGPYDPFTKTPLTNEDLVPLPELKAKIDKWLDEKRAIYRQKYSQSAKTTFKDANNISDDAELYQTTQKKEDDDENFLGGFRKV